MSDAVAIHLSDLHIGEETDSFNVAVARERLGAIAELAEIDKATREIWVLPNGDLSMGAANFCTQIAEAEVHTREQHRECTSGLVGLIRGLHRRHPKARLRVRFRPGNHGKIGDHEHPDSNADLEVGDRVRELLAGESWCDVESGRGFSGVLSIAGTRVLMQHQAISALQVDPAVVMVCRPGEQPKPEGAARATPAQLRKVRTWLSQYSAHLLLAGHFHFPAAWWVDEVGGPRLIYVQNGSLVGPNDYAAKKAMFSRPAQSVIYFGARGAEDVRWLCW